jgi:hypothetical protein
MEFVALIAGFALPWALGASLLFALPAGGASGRAAWKWGCGWFVGVFLLTLWMRALSLAGIPFGIGAIAGPLVVATALLAWFVLHRQKDLNASLRATGSALAGGHLAGWQRVVWIALLAWLFTRFAFLLYEVAVRPLYPWDAWTQWATKSRVWFGLRTMAPFVNPVDWFATRGAAGYIDAAPHYPATVPLTQVWGALLVGRWDDALVNFPWWVNGLALGLAIYGALDHRKFPPLVALTGTWLVLSLPILNVHIALAGYADLAMSAYFTLAALAALDWTGTRRWQDALLALLLVAACVTVKNPGKMWALTLVPGIVVALTPRFGLRIAGAGFVLVAALVAVLAQTNLSLLGYQLQGQFRLPWSALADAYLMFGNWNLLWYGLLATAVLGWRNLLAPELASLTVILAAGLMFLFFGFAFTNAGVWVEDQSTVNRATLHIAPLLVVWMMLTFRSWLQAAPTAPVPGAAGAG